MIVHVRFIGYPLRTNSCPDGLGATGHPRTSRTVYGGCWVPHSCGFCKGGGFDFLCVETCLSCQAYRWLKLHTYAATAFTCSSVNSAPPFAGIGLRYSFGCATPSLIVFVIPAKLPSLHNHFLPSSGGPSVDPCPLAPWQPMHGAPPTCPW